MQTVYYYLFGELATEEYEKPSEDDYISWAINNPDEFGIYAYHEDKNSPSDLLEASKNWDEFTEIPESIHEILKMIRDKPELNVELAISLAARSILINNPMDYPDFDPNVEIGMPGYITALVMDAVRPLSFPENISSDMVYDYFNNALKK
ncbi:hypothetical protein [Jiulongibacter sp. NS-SX5]|uniref:hypothetical protein n=1 Tax=Jiulongibacter sp. NS-SX5 TaxID=3463854 RepID=UPI004059D8D5